MYARNAMKKGPAHLVAGPSFRLELFEGHGVSFVSVTQQFNTTTSPRWPRAHPDRRSLCARPPRDGTADKSEPFAEGWLDENGEYLGRPVDVAQLRDGSLLVSDDFAGALYRSWYDGK